MSGGEPRYAIYYAPDSTSPLWRFGCAVLGYDADLGVNVPFAEGLQSAFPSWAALTADPRSYGFHATLKAPFRLQHGVSEQELLSTVETFAACSPICRLKSLDVASLGRFIALVPRGDIEALLALAARCVDGFEPMRAPLSDADKTRRLRTPLSPAQLSNLEQYGYPYVHDEFRFHMTLTGSLPSNLVPTVAARLRTLHQQSVGDGPVVIDSIAVFKQTREHEPFKIMARQSLA